MSDTTTIRVSRETRKDLHDLKEPGVTYDDVIRSFLENTGDLEAAE